MTDSPLVAENYPTDYFDVITSFEVIEHINNPLNELLSMKKILRTGGLVYITTPNFNSISRDIVGPKWNIIEYPEHLSYYTRQTLSKLFGNQKFSTIEIRTTGISVSRIRRSKGAVTTHENNFDENFRQRAHKNFMLQWLKDGINLFLNASSKGDAMKAFFVKQ